MSYADGKKVKAHNDPSMAVKTVGTAPLIKAETTSVPPTAWKPQKKKRMVGG